MAYIHARRENSSDEASYLAFATQTSGGTHPERMRIDSSGRLLVGTSTAFTDTTNGAHYAKLASVGNTSSSTGDGRIALSRGAAASTLSEDDSIGGLYFSDNTGGGFAAIEVAVDGTPGASDYPGRIVFSTTADAASSPTGRMTIDSSGRVGIGTASPDANSLLDVNGVINIADGNALAWGGGFSRPAIVGSNADDTIKFNINGFEACRLDSSRRLLVGTSTSRSVDNEKILQIEGTDLQTSSMSLTRNTNSVSPPNIALGKSRGTTIGSNTIVQDGDSLGIIVFCGADGTDLNSIAAGISGQVDGTPGANDMPGRLVFSTTADGASSPTERLRIAQSGAFGLSGANYGSSGQVLTSQGSGSAPQWADAGGGKILQVVSTTKTDTFSTSSSTLTDITGLSVSITPSSSSSKILVVAYINGVIDTGSSSYGGRLQLVRGSTNIAQGDAAGSRQVGTGHLGGQDSWPFFQSTTITYLDSPSTTSSTTYKIQCAHTQSRTIQINTADGDQNSSTFGLRTVSTITVMEVAA